jgi:hypothetical protein
MSQSCVPFLSMRFRGYHKFQRVGHGVHASALRSLPAALLAPMSMRLAPSLMLAACCWRRAMFCQVIDSQAMQLQPKASAIPSFPGSPELTSDVAQEGYGRSVNMHELPMGCMCDASTAVTQS